MVSESQEREGERRGEWERREERKREARNLFGFVARLPDVDTGCV